MYYVYLIKSVNYPDHVYVGFTENLEKRLHDHNSGSSHHTKQYKP
jgi:predicted GIY-YIG superfamily endonuclease